MNASWASSWLRSAIVWLVAAKIFGIITLFDIQFRTLQAVELPKALFSRSIAWLLAGLVLLALARYGRGILPGTPVNLFVAAYVAANVLAAVLAEDRYVAFFGAQTHFLGLTFVLDMAMLYLAVAVAYRTGRDWAALGGAFLVAAVITVLYAFVQYRGLDPLPWAVDTRVRPFSTLGNPNMYAHFLTVVVGVGVGVALCVHAAFARIAGAGVAVVAVATSVVVATRGSLVGLAFVVVAAAAVYALRARRATTVRRLVLSLGLVGILVAVVIFATPLGSRARATIEGRVPINDRIVVYAGALRAALDRPILGYGPDHMIVTWPRYRSEVDARSIIGPTVTTDSAHSWVLDELVETGIVGLSAQAALLMVVFARLAVMLRTPAVVLAGPALIGLAGYVGHGLTSVGALSVDWVPWVVYAVAAASVARSPGPLSQRAIPWPAAAVVLTLALAVAATGRSALDANRNAYDARRATALGFRERALASAESAIRNNPGRAEYWNELGRARYSASDWSGASAAFEGAAERAPYDPDLWVNLARARLAEATAGTRAEAADAALAAARRAVAAAQNYQPGQLMLATAAAAAGDHDLAARAAVRSLQLWPTADAVRVLIEAAPKLDRPAARRLITDALQQMETARLRSLLAALALEDGDRVEARANALRALVLDPADSEAQRVLRSLP